LRQCGKAGQHDDNRDLQGESHLLSPVRANPLAIWTTVGADLSFKFCMRDHENVKVVA
jgi:hypothetical protein